MPRSGRALAAAAVSCQHGPIEIHDRDGNLFSTVASEGGQSGAPIPGTGLLFCLRGTQSSFDPGHPNALAPGKRPRCTPAPALKHGEPYMAFGGYSGDHIPQATPQIFLNIAEFGLGPQQAVEVASRWRIERY